jgi:hypothetical protein
MVSRVRRGGLARPWPCSPPAPRAALAGQPALFLNTVVPSCRHKLHSSPGILQAFMTQIEADATKQDPSRMSLTQPGRARIAKRPQRGDSARDSSPLNGWTSGRHQLLFYRTTKGLAAEAIITWLWVRHAQASASEERAATGVVCPVTVPSGTSAHGTRPDSCGAGWGCRVPKIRSHSRPFWHRRDRVARLENRSTFRLAASRRMGSMRSFSSGSARQNL